MNKKGQSMSLNVIVVAAIVILVLLVLAILFVRSSGDFARTSEGCEALGGTCIGGSSCPGNSVERTFGARCENTNHKCCIPLNTSRVQ